jgi:putative PIN family toxin of toxin-antitoxin system
MPLPRVILDTSVVVSALRSNRGASFQLLNALFAGTYTIAISASLVFEYEEVLVRDLVPAFHSLDEVDQFIRFICEIGDKYDPSPMLRPVLADPDDDMLVDLAVAAAVDYIVTHNTRDLAGAAVHGLAIITPGRFLKLLREPS